MEKQNKINGNKHILADSGAVMTIASHSETLSHEIEFHAQTCDNKVWAVLHMIVFFSINILFETTSSVHNVEFSTFL